MSSQSSSSSRRNFIKLAASGVAAASALSAVSASADDAATAASARSSGNEPGPFDLVIAGGRVIDPESGLDATRNVGIKGGRIAAISKKGLEGK